MQLLECSGWLSGCCHAVARVFCVVDNVLLGSC